MKKEKDAVCPGCHRHCPMHQLHCKYGKNYFAKKLAKEQEEKVAEPKRRWEKFVTDGEVLHQMIDLSRRTKKALCHQKTTEDHLLAALECQERETLHNLLDKLDAALNEKAKKHI